MADNKSYIALDWVNDEIADTLTQAIESLEAFVANPSDVTKLRFCMTYTFQASGSLKMIELHGPAQLSVELEALLGKTLDEVNAEQVELQAAIVKRGLILLVDYLSKAAKTHTENPNDLLPLLNEVRGALEEEEVTASDLYDPTLNVPKQEHVQEASISEEDFDELIRKLRQSFQTGLIGIVRNADLANNFDTINKVTAKLEKVSEQTASFDFWEIAAAVTESLLLQETAVNIDTKKALKQIDHQLKYLHDDGRAVFSVEVDHSSIKTLLYVVANDEQPTHKINALREKYQLQESVADKQQSLQERLYQQISDSVQGSIDNEQLALACVRSTELLIGEQLPLDDIASHLANNTADFEAFNQRLTQLLSTNRDRLDAIKERIVEYVATQWQREAIVALPDLLDETIVDLEHSCFSDLLPLLHVVKNYISQELLEAESPQPDIKRIEALADIISGVEYYLECFSSQAQQQLSNIVQIAQESISVLNFELV
ncbi:MAG: hypothetical protein KAG18_01710, partial [Sinobacterium sp.]|nr:hypothetical protein [Sinobacterium sp.]